MSEKHLNLDTEDFVGFRKLGPRGRDKVCLGAAEEVDLCRAEGFVGRSGIQRLQARAGIPGCRA